MKTTLRLIALGAVTLIPFTSLAKDTYVQSYHRKDGTYVAGHYRSGSDNTVTNNYSYQGNVNPHTGQTGTNHYAHDRTSPYYNGPDNNGRVGHDSFNNNRGFDSLGR